MTTATNSENLGKYNRRYSLIVRDTDFVFEQ